MSLRQSFVPKKCLKKNLLSAEEREKRMMQRIFDHIPRRKRTPYSYLLNTRNGATRSAYVTKKNVQEDKDVILKRILINVPRTTDYEYIPPKDPPQTRPNDSQASPKPPQVPKPPTRPRQINTPEWLIQVMRGMDGAEDPKLIILEKTLNVNDVDSKKNRLSIPINSVIQNDFLTLEESRIIDDDDITNNEGEMGVGSVLVDPGPIQYFLMP